MTTSAHSPLPLADRPDADLPGHWLLARLGKRVLRPGGVELTRRLLAAAEVGGADVVELGPGLGRTASDIVAAKLASKCEVQFAYAIGHPLPVSVHVDTFGTGTKSDDAILAAILKVFSFKPADIVKQLNLLRPIYGKSTNYGHFGKSDPDLTWERTDKVAALQKAAK